MKNLSKATKTTKTPKAGSKHADPFKDLFGEK